MVRHNIQRLLLKADHGLDYVEEPYEAACMVHAVAVMTG